MTTCILCNAPERDYQGYCRDCKRAPWFSNVSTWWRATRSAAFDMGELPSWPWARFENETWRARCDARVVAALEKFEGRENLAVFAPTGRGKSTSQIAWVHRELGRVLARAHAGNFCNPTVAYITGAMLSETHRRRRLGAPEHELVTRACEAHVLMLDQVDEHTLTEPLFTVLDARYGRGHRATVLASGLEPSAFAAHCGAHVLRRVLEGGALLDLHAASPKRRTS